MFYLYNYLWNKTAVYENFYLLVRRIENYELHKMLISSTTWKTITLIKFKIQEKFAFVYNFFLYNIYTLVLKL